MSEFKSGLPPDFKLPPDYVPPEDRRRIARICRRCDPPRRTFGDPEWVCPDHGVAETQENRPYFGQSTKDGPAGIPGLRRAADLLEGDDGEP